MQPLLELVEDDQHLLARRNPLSSAKCGDAVSQAQILRQARTLLPQSPQQPGFGLLGSGLDVDGNHMLGQAGATTLPSPATTCRSPMARRSGPREKSCRRRSLRSGFSRSGCCRAVRPGPEGREQFQEEIGVLGIEGPQALGHDLDGLARIQSSGRGCRSCGSNRLVSPPSQPSTGFTSCCLGQEMPQVFRHVDSRRVTLRWPVSTGPSGRSVPVPWESYRPVAAAGGVPGVLIRSRISSVVVPRTVGWPSAIRRRPRPG